MNKVLIFAACGVVAIASFAITGCTAQSQTSFAYYQQTAPATSNGFAHALGTPPPTAVPNELTTGSSQRTLSAGPVTAAVNYTSDLAMDRWTAGAMKPITVKLSTTLAPDDLGMVYLESVSLVAIPYDGDMALTALTALTAQVDRAKVDPGYLILAPDSYTQTFDIGSLPARADRVVMEVHCDFLVQSASKSYAFAKHAISDRLTVAIARQK